MRSAVVSKETKRPSEEGVLRRDKGRSLRSQRLCPCCSIGGEGGLGALAEEPVRGLGGPPTLPVGLQLLTPHPLQLGEHGGWRVGSYGFQCWTSCIHKLASPSHASGPDSLESIHESISSEAQASGHSDPTGQGQTLTLKSLRGEQPGGPDTVSDSSVSTLCIRRAGGHPAGLCWAQRATGLAPPALLSIPGCDGTGLVGGGRSWPHFQNCLLCIPQGRGPVPVSRGDGTRGQWRFSTAHHLECLWALGEMQISRRGLQKPRADFSPHPVALRKRNCAELPCG